MTQTTTLINVTPRASPEECETAKQMLFALQRTKAWGVFYDKMYVWLKRGYVISKKQFESIKWGYEKNCKRVNP